VPPLDGLPSAAFTGTDYWRRSPASRGGRAGHKEWSYFCVLAPELDLLVNFSLMDAANPRGAPRLDVPRLVVLARSRRDGWDGDIEHFATEDVDVRAGGTDARFGGNGVQFVEGAYRLELALAARPIEASLTLRPLIRPAVATSVRLAGGGPMRWLVVPRLAAEGVVRIAGVSHRLLGCPAYHDRNWGHFSWGADFSWEWAVVLPDDPSVPWTVVYMRIGDRRRARTLSQGLIVWRGDEAGRTFHGADLDVRLSGLLQIERPFRVPRVTHLLVPGVGSDVPRRVDVDASGGGDRMSCSIELAGLAQVGIPKETGPGLTLLSETAGRAVVRGRIRGADVDFEGRAVVELNHAAG